MKVIISHSDGSHLAGLYGGERLINESCIKVLFFVYLTVKLITKELI